MNKQTVVCVALLTFVGLSGTSAYAANSLSERIAGVWVGSGSIHKAPGAPLERVRCRFSSKWSKRSQSISLRYICLGIDIKFETTGTLKYKSATQTIAGKLVTVGIGAFRASGKDKRNSVNLALSGKDKKTGKAVSGTLSIRLKGKNALTSTLTATDPKSGKRFRAFTARFKR